MSVVVSAELYHPKAFKVLLENLVQHITPNASLDITVYSVEHAKLAPINTTILLEYVNSV
jgi:hypothetical protein